ncbi:hypothetical protein LINPERHAP1_LOCUS1913 [Linum perenne]
MSLNTNTGCRRPPFRLLPSSPLSVPLAGSPFLLRIPHKEPCITGIYSRCCRGIKMDGSRGGRFVCSGWFLPVDPWAPTIDSQSIASQLFAFSLFPYIGFLYFLTKSKTAPGLTLFGFYFLLAFVGATILGFLSILLNTDVVPFAPWWFLNDRYLCLVPAGIYAKVQYGTSLSNVDWLHGGAESLLTLTNLFIVLGLRQALRKGTDVQKEASTSSMKERKQDI